MTRGRVIDGWVAFLGPSLLVVVGCEALGDPNDDPCRRGPGASASVKVHIPSEESLCFLCEDWGFWGDARVESLSGEAGHFSLTLSFPEDATWVSLDIAIPADADLPLAEGDEITASVAASCCWYSSFSTVSLSTLTGLPLLEAYTGGATVEDIPPACEDTWECGKVGYPDLVAQHPVGRWDPSAPWTKLRQGEEVLQVHRGVAYRSIVSVARTWTENLCTDTPQTYLSRATVLVPLPVPIPVPVPFPSP